MDEFAKDDKKNRRGRYTGGYYGMDSSSESSSDEEYGNSSSRRAHKLGMMRRNNKSSNTPDVNLDNQEAVRALQQAMVEAVAGKIRELSSLQKGNYGEAKAGIHFSGNSMKAISRNPVVKLDQSTHKGIDLVVREDDGKGAYRYYIIEAKVGTSKLSILPDGTRQMSWDWILPRLKDAVGEELASQIESALKDDDNNVIRVVYHVDLDGNSDTEFMEDDW